MHMECPSIDASQEDGGDDSHVICSHVSHVSHGVAQVATHSQVESQGTGVFNVQMQIWRCINHVHLYLNQSISVQTGCVLVQPDSEDLETIH
jgi:hypothetical protein